MHTNTDITELIKAEEKLNKAFAASFDQVGVGAAYMTCEGRFLRVNQAFCATVGYSADELLKRTCQEITHPDDLNINETCISQMRKEGRTSQTAEKRYIHKSGKAVWTEITFTVVLDEAGELIWVVCIVRDIKERKKMEKALLESEEKFRTLVTHTEAIVYMVAEDGTFLLSEGKGLAKLGLKPGQVVGKSVFDLYKDYPDMLLEMKRAFSGETVVGEAFVDGHFFRSWYTPHKNPEGEPCGLLGLSVNITEQKQAEKQIQEYQLRLKALASELTLAEERERHIIALDLHDQVGQSLAVMRMQLAVAQKVARSSKVAAILDEVSGSLRQAIQDTRHVISDLSSPLMNELGLSTALAEWLKERVGAHHGLELQFIDDDEPKPLSKDTRAILFRSVRELLTNVIKHADATRVSVSLQRRGGAVQLVVEDNGVGLADGRHPELDVDESGFGLFSIKERMSDLGGALEIESHHGQGVRVTLTAPLEPDHING